jgi:hypothetical protein
MKAYDLNSSFTFGKYEGKSLDEVFNSDPAYIEKCMMTVDDFAIDEKAIQKLFEKYPDAEFSDQAVDANMDKLDAMDGPEDDYFEEEGYADDDLDDLDDIAGKPRSSKGDDDDFTGIDDDEDDLFTSDGLDEDWDDDDEL